MIKQRGTGSDAQRVPVVAVGNDHTFFFRQFQEEQVSQLFDIVTVADAIVPQGVAEPPEFANYIGHSTTARLISFRSSSRRPPKSRLALFQPPWRENGIVSR